MNLRDLSASELARIDSVCLEFESNLRAGRPQDIDQLVDLHGGTRADVLREELQAIKSEIENSTQLETSAGKHSGVFVTETPASSRVGPNQLPRVGEAIGPYRIGKVIGRGGMGIVYQATDTRLGRQVAIKLLIVPDRDRRELTQRFEREAKAVAALSHPNIVELFDVGIRDNTPYAVMELLRGQTLEERFAESQTQQTDSAGARELSPSEIRFLGGQIADALAVAHQAGVIHRDLKPQNVMLVESTGQAKTASKTNTILKLLDFGLSHIARDEVADGQTRVGVVMGTPGYMAPEQVRGELVTPAADLFSLGCVLYEAFYGHRAFDGPTVAQRNAATLEHTPQPDPLRRRDDVELADLIQHCLNKDVAQRPTSATEIAGVLRGDASSIDAYRRAVQSGYETGRITRRRLLMLVGGGSAASVAGFLLSHGDSSQIESIAVLPFNEIGNTNARTNEETPDLAEPIGDRKLQPGELLAALLVTELTRISSLAVRRFRSGTVKQHSDIQQIGKQLDVDAVLVGTYRTLNDIQTTARQIEWEIVETETGRILALDVFNTNAGDNLLQQSQLAQDIAEKIGRSLRPTATDERSPSVEAFNCLVDGNARSDPDSTEGLEMALMCFQKAHDADVLYAQPLAGIALTSITLAAQSQNEKALELILDARRALDEVLHIDPDSIDARLAKAMIDWQTLYKYEEARRTLHELAMVAPNNWQVHHQYGLLSLVAGNGDIAKDRLLLASRLNPTSLLVKVDRLRAFWFLGDREYAISEATRLNEKFGNPTIVVGLLIDLFEELGNYRDAADLDSAFPKQNDFARQDYLMARRGRLAELPYGPFGSMNDAIIDTRLGDISDNWLAGLAEETPPTLPLLLATHPGFAEARKLQRASEVLPR